MISIPLNFTECTYYIHSYIPTYPCRWCAMHTAWWFVMSVYDGKLNESEWISLNFSLLNRYDTYIPRYIHTYVTTVHVYSWIVYVRNIGICMNDFNWKSLNFSLWNTLHTQRPLTYFFPMESVCSYIHTLPCIQLDNVDIYVRNIGMYEYVCTISTEYPWILPSRNGVLPSRAFMHWAISNSWANPTTFEFTTTTPAL
jgi:hypothetical protein